jgi:hypothetical protein
MLKIMEKFGFISKKKIIKLFAEELAEKQKDADYWYYIKNNQEMSSFMLEKVDELKTLLIKFDVCNEVYNEAYKIYDFRNSGKKDFVPDLELLYKI